MTTKLKTHTTNAELQALYLAEEKTRKNAGAVKVPREALRHLLMDYTGVLGVLRDRGLSSLIEHPRD
jgi:hypothetical protein